MGKPTTTKKGFTLIELMTVVAIVGILAALAISISTKGVRQSHVQGSTQNLIMALHEAKGLAQAQARDMVMVVVDAASGGGSCEGSMANPDCLRYYQIGDVIGPPGTVECPGATPCAPFTDTDLTTFVPPPSPSEGLRLPNGDILVGFGAFERGVAMVDASSISALPPFSGIPTVGRCSFCNVGTTPLMGFVKFAPNGTASMSPAASPAGGMLFLGASDGASVVEKRGVAISLPAGLVSTRLWKETVQ